MFAKLSVEKESMGDSQARRTNEKNKSRKACKYEDVKRGVIKNNAHLQKTFYFYFHTLSDIRKHE